MNMSLNFEPVIETISGKQVSLRNPTPEQITLKDIGWGLSRQARYNGHTPGDHAYSVAQHSVWVAMIVQQHFNASAATTRLALYHDAHESYTGDVVRPLKYMSEFCASLKSIESRLQRTIYKALDIKKPSVEQSEIVTTADRYALAVEAYHLMVSKGYRWTDSTTPPILFDSFQPALPAKKAYEQFWMADNYIQAGHNLEEICCQS